MVKWCGIILLILSPIGIAAPTSDAQLTYIFVPGNEPCTLQITDGDGSYKFDSDQPDFEEKAMTANINYDAEIKVASISHINFMPSESDVYLSVNGTEKTISEWKSDAAEDISKGSFSLMLRAEHPRDDLYGKSISTTVDLAVTCK